MQGLTEKVISQFKPFECFLLMFFSDIFFLVAILT